MLKELIVGAVAIVASVVPLSGIASAEDGRTYAGEGDDQIGLLNLNNTDVLHNLNGNVGVCDNNVNVLGVQVVVEDVANGLAIPIASSGATETFGATPSHCASAEISDGGTIQDN